MTVFSQHAAPLTSGFSSRERRRWLFRPACTVLLLCLPACTSQTLFGPGNGYVHSIHTPEEQNTVYQDSQVQPKGHVRIHAPRLQKSAARPAVMTSDPAGSPPNHAVIPVSWDTATTVNAASATQFMPAEPRLDPSLGRLTPADLYPDEYLVDGGDRGQPVHYFGDTRQGFETEDTIAEYADHLGKQHVRSSSRVAVYAPRFGAVRVIEGANADIQVRHAAQAKDVAAVGSLHRQDIVEQAVRDAEPVAVGSRRRADGAETRRSHLLAEQETRPQLNNKVDQGMEGWANSSLSLLERNQSSEISHQLANAVIWTRETFPVLSASTSQAGRVETRFTAQATVGIDDERAEKSEIRVIKLADRETAGSGDIVGFTIRFVNTGDYDLHDVRIVDNLTPRLQFIPDSAQTDRSGEVISEPNGEGSQVLTFEFDEPLRARESGTIEFKARVK